MLPALRLSINFYRYQKWGFSVACSAGFASCKTFGKQPKHPCFGRSPKAGRRDASPCIHPRHGCRACMHKGFARCKANQAYTAFHGERGQFGMDAEIRTRRALHEAKPSECPKGDRGSELEVCFKNILFLQTEGR